MTGRAGAMQGQENSLERGSRRNLHEQIAHAIGLQIVRGDYREGALLPTEIALADRFGVSRTAVREAFRILAAKGLTTSRPKIGTRVRPQVQWNLLDQEVLSWLLSRPEDSPLLVALFELRLLVEPEAAALAAERRTDRDLKALAQSITAMQRAGSPDGMIEGVLAFHQALLDAAHNPFVRSLGTLIESVLRFSLSWESRIENLRTEFDFITVKHASVVEAVRQGEPALARERITEILRLSLTDIQATVERRRSA